MKSIALFLMLSAALATGATRKSVFHGEISDSECAMNVHFLSRSHEEMTSKKTNGHKRRIMCKDLRPQRRRMSPPFRRKGLSPEESNRRRGVFWQESQSARHAQ